MRAFLFVPVLLALGCAEPAPEAPPVIEPEPPAPTDPPAPPPAPPIAESTRPWRWYHAPPERDTGGMLGDGALHDHTVIPEVGRPRRFTIARDGGALVVRREDRNAWDPPIEAAWERRHEAGVAGPPVIGAGLTADHLLVAAPTARGYLVLALDPDDGTERWRRTHEVDGPGPVQLGFEADALVVYVRAEPAPYLHALDPATGAITARARFGAEVLRTFARPAARALPRSRPSPGGWRLVREGREGLAVEGPSGRTVLTEQALFDDHAAFVELDDLVVVVTFCANASGAEAYGVDRATGHRAWTASPGSIGSIGHSRYSNDVRAVREGDRVVVYGEESGGRYVGVLDPREGRLVGYEVWRR